MRGIAIGVVIAALCIVRPVAGAPLLDAVDDLKSAYGDKPRVLVMPLDARCIQFTLDGAELMESCIDNARANYLAGIQKHQDEVTVDILLLENDQDLTDTEIDYRRLSYAVGVSIDDSQVNDAPLNSKHSLGFWTMGPGVQEIGAQHQADYALFSNYRAYALSPGVEAKSAGIAATVTVLSLGLGALNAIGNFSKNIGISTLVDLDTGDVVWAKRFDYSASSEQQSNIRPLSSMDRFFDGFPQ